MLDGLKPGQRKILFGCFKRNLSKDIKVIYCLTTLHHVHDDCTRQLLNEQCCTLCAPHHDHWPHAEAIFQLLLSCNAQIRMQFAFVVQMALALSCVDIQMCTICCDAGESVGRLCVGALSIPPWRCQPYLHHSGHGTELCWQQQHQLAVPFRSASNSSMSRSFFSAFLLLVIQHITWFQQCAVPGMAVYLLQLLSHLSYPHCSLYL